MTNFKDLCYKFVLLQLADIWTTDCSSYWAQTHVWMTPLLTSIAGDQVSDTPAAHLCPPALMICNPSNFFRKQSKCSAAQRQGINHERRHFISHDRRIVATAAKHSGKANYLWRCSSNDETESLPYRQAARWIILIDYFEVGWEMCLMVPLCSRHGGNNLSDIFITLSDPPPTNWYRVWGYFSFSWKPKWPD